MYGAARFFESGGHAGDKGEHLREISGKHASGPEGPENSIAITPGINPRPTLKQDSAAT
jgi:hypothetical protein